MKKVAEMRKQRVVHTLTFERRRKSREYRRKLKCFQKEMCLCFLIVFFKVILAGTDEAYFQFGGMQHLCDGKYFQQYFKIGKLTQIVV